MKILLWGLFYFLLQTSQCGPASGVPRGNSVEDEIELKKTKGDRLDLVLQALDVKQLKGLANLILKKGLNDGHERKAAVRSGTEQHVANRYLTSDDVARLKPVESDCTTTADTCTPLEETNPFRAINGRCNNLAHPEWGTAGRPQARLIKPQYSQNDMPRKASDGSFLPSARLVSQTLLSSVSQTTTPSSPVATLMMMQLGQFIDHDLSHTPVTPTDITTGTSSPTSCNPQQCDLQQLAEQQSECYPVTAADGGGLDCTAFVRSQDFCTTGTREQGNDLTSWLDLSQVYGSTEHELHELRESVPNANGVLEATCDNEMKVFFDGVEQRAGRNTKNWAKTDRFRVPGDTEVIGIQCKDKGVAAGILASLNNGNVMTDPTWTCSNQFQDGWSEPDFIEGNTWNNAITFGTNAAPPIWTKNLGTIAANANWIWTVGPLRTNPDLNKTVYCRKNIKQRTLEATCDNQMKVFFDGVQQGPAKNAKDWTKTDRFNVPLDTEVIGIECKDNGVAAGILASMNDGTITDESWTCSNQKQNGWNEANFEEGATWNNAISFGTNVKPPIWTANIGNIAPSAQWIWTVGPLRSNPDLFKTVYCRKNVARRGRMAVSPHPLPGLRPMLPSATGGPEVTGCRQNNTNIKCFHAGDIRQNEQVGLMSMHTLLVRMHNDIEERLFEESKQQPKTAEQLFQESRKLNIAFWQHIIFQEYLPVLLGDAVIDSFGIRPQVQGQHFTDYSESVRGDIFNVFAAAALRMGHSELKNFMTFVDKTYTDAEQIQFNNLVFNPTTLYECPLTTEKSGIDALVLGLISTTSGDIDGQFPQQITENLFTDNPPFGKGFDLAALNIQRGRDHGLPGYLEWRKRCSLPENLDELSREGFNHNELVQVFEDLYNGEKSDIDLYAAAMNEAPRTGSLIGPTFACLIALQFRNLKYGDRFYYENDEDTAFTPDELKEIHKFSFAQLLCDTLDEVDTIQPHVLLKPEVNAEDVSSVFTGRGDNTRVSCENIRDVDYGKLTNIARTP